MTDHDFNFRVVKKKVNNKMKMALSKEPKSFRVKANLFDCPVCCCKINAPKVLKCGHSFCKNCLADILKSKLLKDDVLQAPENQMHIACPNCREESEAFSSLGDLKTNFFVNQLLDAYNDEMEQHIPPSACICGEQGVLQCYR